MYRSGAYNEIWRPCVAFEISSTTARRFSSGTAQSISLSKIGSISSLRIERLSKIDRIRSFQVLDEHFYVPYRDRFEEGEFRKRVQFMYGGKPDDTRPQSALNALSIYANQKKFPYIAPVILP